MSFNASSEACISRAKYGFPPLKHQEEAEGEPKALNATPKQTFALQWIRAVILLRPSPS